MSMVRDLTNAQLRVQCNQQDGQKLGKGGVLQRNRLFSQQDGG
jgi:hypothetical protein